MALVSIPFNIRYPGHTERWNFQSAAISSAGTLDAAGEYFAIVMIAKEDMTVSHVGFRTATITGSGTLDVRIETVDSSGNPSGTLWGTNTNIAGSALTSTAWHLVALTSSASISRGSIFCIKFAYNSGTSATVVVDASSGNSASLPYDVLNTGSPSRTAGRRYAVALGSSASTFYTLDNCLPVTGSFATQSFNNTNSAARGMRFQVPFPCRCAGLMIPASGSGNFNYMIQDDSNNELSSSSTALNGVHQSTTTRLLNLYFDSPVSLSTGTWYRAVVQPSSSTNISFPFWDLPSSSYLSGCPGGDNCYYTTYTSGGGWVNDTAKIPLMELIIDQLDNGVGGGGSGGVPLIGAGGLVY